MKTLLFVLFLGAMGMGSLAVNRGWFTVNARQIEQDENAAKTRMHDLSRTVKEKVSELKDRAGDDN